MVQTYDYDAFGNVVLESGSLTNEYKYKSKETSPNTGLVYFGARYYNSLTGRFINPDTLGMVDGPNMYLYCENDSVNYIDPWGLFIGIGIGIDILPNTDYLKDIGDTNKIEKCSVNDGKSKAEHKKGKRGSSKGKHQKGQARKKKDNRGGEKGDKYAQCNLGWCYKNGFGIRKDYSKALYWTRKSAVDGNEKGQYNLGLDYYYGDGVKSDKKKAVFWFKKAALQKHKLAQYYLGLAYENGDGVKRDMCKAIK
ncbi:MAG: RHS repeat-associated core domain-containing protein [Candidatus Omnitrophota bacterium]